MTNETLPKSTQIRHHSMNITFKVGPTLKTIHYLNFYNDFSSYKKSNANEVCNFTQRTVTILLLFYFSAINIIGVNSVQGVASTYNSSENTHKNT